MRTFIPAILFVALLLIAVQPGGVLLAQDAYLPGYDTTVSGTSMEYASPITAAKKALIARASDGTSTIVWRTVAVPEGQGNSPVTFAWLAGLGTNIGEKRFTLFVNGKETASFTTAPRDAWEVAGSGGVRLTFKTVMKDRANDRFGFMHLTLPPGMAQPGKPVELKISGEAAKSSAWVMTFTYALADGFTVVQRPVLMREKGSIVQPLDMEVINSGAARQATVKIAGVAEQSFNVPFGVSRQTIMLDPVTTPTTMQVDLAMGEFRKSAQASLAPVRPWTIYLVQHTHTDIGYTRPQTEILSEHLRYIDYALDYCDQTDSYPEDAKFRWTCETSWAVREYLKTRPATQIARLKKRVQEGRIEVTGMLLNWAEVADENTLVHSLEPVKTMREMGMPVKTGVQDDVNGYAWCFVDYFQTLGIRYVTSGINAHRAIKPFKVPTPFWWESPSGRRVLAYRADHYMTGNFYNVHGENFELVERELPGYLLQLEAAGYPYNRVNLQYSGYFTDNSPPSTYSSENIRRWNERYESPKLRSATISEFLQWMEKEHGASLPVYRVAWPDWWTDGYGCALRETAANRRSQVDLIVNQGLLAMAQTLGAKIPESVLRQVESVADNVNFYSEHTFGAAESISDPMAENTQVQWAEKSSYAWQGVLQTRLLREAALGQIQSFLSPVADPSVVVFNTLNWVRSGLHILYVDNEILPREKAVRIMDERGREVPAQVLTNRAEGNYWALWVDEVPALGYKTYRVSVSGNDAASAVTFEPKDVIENQFYRLTLDRSSGAVRGLFDREMGMELLDPRRAWQLGQFIYERLADRTHMEALKMGEHTRTTLRNIQVKPGVDGPVWQSIVLTGVADGFSEDKGITCEIRLFKVAKRIDMVFRGSKLPVNDPEAVYVSFPFAMRNGELVFEAQGGVVRPGENQLPGTANDWNTVQNFAAVRGPEGQILMVSDEIPLVQFGGINTGRYNPEARPESNQIFSWVLNNYWTTNFRSSQEGEMSWSYVLTSVKDTSNATASQFGWGARVPFISRVLPKAAGTLRSQSLASASLWPFEPSSILLVAARPAPQGMIFHLRETAGKEATLGMARWAKGWKMEEVDALGAPVKGSTSPVFKPYEARFLRVWSQPS